MIPHGWHTKSPTESATVYVCVCIIHSLTLMPVSKTAGALSTLILLFSSFTKRACLQTFRTNSAVMYVAHRIHGNGALQNTWKHCLHGSTYFHGNKCLCRVHRNSVYSESTETVSLQNTWKHCLHGNTNLHGNSVPSSPSSPSMKTVEDYCGVLHIHTSNLCHVCMCVSLVLSPSLLLL